jgi:hypothetical protein
MSVRLSVCVSVHMEQLGSHWMDFHEILHLMIFQKSVEKIQVSLKSDKNSGYLIRTYVNLRKYLAKFFLADPSGRAVQDVGLRPLACWDSGFESRRQQECLSIVSVVCCQVEVSVSGYSLVQRSVTECGVSKKCDREASTMGRPLEKKRKKILLRIRTVSDKTCRENENIHIMFNNFSPRKSCRLWDNVEKYGRPVQATQMAK